MSADFENDSQFWSKHLEDLGDYIKFFNIKSNNYKSIKIPLDNKKLSEFLSQYNVSRLDFITAVFSLYISRINRSVGCLLKTRIPSSVDDSDINTILKIDYLEDQSFIEHMKEIKNVWDIAAEHSKGDIENYIDEELSYYSIYDFTKLKAIDGLNAEGSALTLNLFEDHFDLVYNEDLFADIFMEHMASNIESLIDEAIESPDKSICELNILSDAEKTLIGEFSKGESIDIGERKSFAMFFRESCIKYGDNLAVDDGT